MLITPSIVECHSKQEQMFFTSMYVVGLQQRITGPQPLHGGGEPEPREKKKKINFLSVFNLSTSEEFVPAGP